MCSKLSLHEKRLLMRYKLLFSHYSSAPVQVRLSELADLMHCSPRYARTLLRDMQSLGWLDWSPGIGRGAAGVIGCRVDAPALRALMDGDYVRQTESIGIPTSETIGSNTERDCYIVPFYRPLMKITPSLYTAWPERHLIRMVHVGLMRYEANCAEPVYGLALAAEISADKLTWTFHLRRGLVWHSGEPFEPAQLLRALHRRAGGPGLPFVNAVDLCGHTLQMELSAPDELLPYRLAHPANAFGHPEEETNGLGPFQIGLQSQSALVLHRSPFWYGVWPHASKISFEVNPCEKPNWTTITVKSERDKFLHMPPRPMSGEGGFTFLMFNQTRTTLSPVQKAVIRCVIQRTTCEIIKSIESVSVLPAWLSTLEHDAEPDRLPPELNVVYCHMPETAALIEHLKKSLAWRSCKLNVTPRMASHWLLPEEDWSAYDFCIGFAVLSMNRAIMFDEYYRNCSMFRTFLGEDWDDRNKNLLAKATSSSKKQHEKRVMKGFRALLRNGVIKPLYIQRWILYTPESARDVKVCELGWPDFSSIWLP